MPKVGKKHYPYTAKGKAAAQKDKQRRKKVSGWVKQGVKSTQRKRKGRK